MIIRRLREDENKKLNAIQSLAFSFPYDRDEEKEGGLHSEVYGAFLDDGETLTATIFTPEFQSCYNGSVLPAVGIGGVASLPEYRRMGSVRAIFDHIFSLAPERGWATSYLYPFSFQFYRQFGYERVIRRHGLKLPANALEKFERNTRAKLYERDGSVRKEELLSVYNAWAIKNNITFARGENTWAWSDKPHASQRFTYLWYAEDGTPAALAAFSCKDGCMRVKELCYLTADALRGMLGFLRMFEGQVWEYDFTELPEDCELDYLLSRYIDAEYHEENGAMGRVLLPGVLLEKNRYPEEHGHFRLKIDDSLDFSRGVWEVEYEHGAAEVKKLPFDAACDVVMTAPPMTRLLLGSVTLDCERAAFLDGVTIENRAGAEDLFRAFPRKPAVLYERF